MDFAADFTAIDFETASRRPDSACQLAAVTVRDGRIVDQAAWLIRPEPLVFSRINVQIHGITPERVKTAPNFGQCWPEIAARLGDDCLVAHNAGFDIGVLLACLRSHGQTIPELQFTCTRAVARRTWPHRHRYGLQPLADWLGIRFRHHDALEDAVACAKILLAAGIDQGAVSLEDLEKRLRLQRGRAGAGGIRSVTGRRSRSRTSGGSPPLGQRMTEPPRSAESPFDFQRTLIRGELIRPLQGRRMVISGRFQTLSIDQLLLLAGCLGGECAPRVDQEVNLLVAGGKAADQDRQRVHQLRVQGHEIDILDEAEFLALISRS